MFKRWIAATVLMISAASAHAEVGETRVAKWRGDAKGAFQLWFDDSAPTDLKNAIPELTKRKLQATFYLNPGAGHYRAFAKQWEAEVPKLGFEYGNHTFTHKGATSEAELEDEVGKCNDVLAKMPIGAKPPGLVSFAIPGVKQGAWTVTPTQIKAVLDKHNLIERPKLDHGMAAIQYKTASDVLKAVDKAIQSGNSDFILFHGVGGDWISFPMPEFTKVLDGLVERRADVWCGGEIETHKYITERDGAAVKVLEANDKHVRLSVTSKADPKLYDTALTLVTQVPTGWSEAKVTIKGGASTSLPVKDAAVRYDVVPGDGAEVTIEPVKR